MVCCDIVRAVVGWQRRGESAAGVLRCWRSGREGGGRWPVAGVLKGEVTREVTINMLLGEACGKARGWGGAWRLPWPPSETTSLMPAEAP